jgi:hypothetical protein
VQGIIEAMGGEYHYKTNMTADSFDRQFEKYAPEVMKSHRSQIINSKTVLQLQEPPKKQITS